MAAAWARRRASQVVYGGVAGVFGLAGCAAWQAKQLELEYKRNGPLPSARGPLGGVARWSKLPRRGSHDAGALGAGGFDGDARLDSPALALPQSAKAAAAATAARASMAAAAVKEKLAAAAAGVAIVRSATGSSPHAGLQHHADTAYAADAPCGATGGSSVAAGGSAGGGASGSGVVHRHVLFIGDSLVTGVGCSQEASNGPAMPRAVAEFLSYKLGVDVGWGAIGSTGSDVRTLQATVIPRLEAESARAAAHGGRIDLVVVLCGLNDFKRASPWRTPYGFRHDLATLVAEIHERVGAQATIVLPALPVHRAPVFDKLWPLQPGIYALAALWDGQKEKVSERLARVRYVGNLEEDEIWAEPAFWAKDGIHPSDEGYRAWGEYIGCTLLNQLRTEWGCGAPGGGGGGGTAGGGKGGECGARGSSCGSAGGSDGGAEATPSARGSGWGWGLFSCGGGASGGGGGPGVAECAAGRRGDEEGMVGGGMLGGCAFLASGSCCRGMQPIPAAGAAEAAVSLSEHASHESAAGPVIGAAFMGAAARRDAAYATGTVGADGS